MKNGIQIIHSGRMFAPLDNERADVSDKPLVETAVLRGPKRVADVVQRAVQRGLTGFQWRTIL